MLWATDASPAPASVTVRYRLWVWQSSLIRCPSDEAELAPRNKTNGGLRYSVGWEWAWSLVRYPPVNWGANPNTMAS